MAEQNDTLTELLGFDPNNPGQEDVLGKKEPTPIKKAALATGLRELEIRAMFEDYCIRNSFGFLSTNPDELFSLRSFGGDAIKVRNYYRVVNGKKGVKIEPYLDIRKLDDVNNPMLYMLDYVGEDGRSEEINISKKGDISFGKDTPNGRVVFVYKNNLLQHSLFYHGSKGAGIQIDVDSVNRSVGNLDLLGKKLPTTVSFNDGHFNLKIDRGKEGQVFANAPLKIDEQTIFSDLLPADLRNNHLDPRTELDEEAKRVTPFARIGATLEIDTRQVF